MSQITIFGAGAWGTALALSLSRRPEHSITLWSHSPEHGAQLLAHRENRKYLPGYPLPDSLRLTSDLAEAAADAQLLITVVPSEHTRAHFERLAPLLRHGQTIISATKGIEDKTHLRMTEVIAEVIARFSADLSAGVSSDVTAGLSSGVMAASPANLTTSLTDAIAEILAPVHLNIPIGVLSGPSFAQEVAAGQPAAITIAFPNMDDAARIQAEFTTPTLRLYRNDDVPGVELGGALKNVIAIAAGAVAGSGLGHNATAALITRGIAETTRLALACGGRRETLAGLSGVGDLVLTCTGSLSRNRLVGLELGRGRQLPDILLSLGGKVAEGVRTTTAALGLAATHNVDMPIATQVAAVLSGAKSTTEAMQDLMSRSTRDE
jgi:glycerol-3-phosphate dehydrogenase (NAD(P)+)